MLCYIFPFIYILSFPFLSVLGISRILNFIGKEKVIGWKFYSATLGLKNETTIGSLALLRTESNDFCNYPRYLRAAIIEQFNVKSKHNNTFYDKGYSVGW